MGHSLEDNKKSLDEFARQLTDEKSRERLYFIVGDWVKNAITLGANLTRFPHADSVKLELREINDYFEEKIREYSQERDEENLEFGSGKIDMKNIII